MGAHSVRRRPLTDLDLTILRAKRRVYTVAVLLCAVAAAVPLIVVLVQQDPFTYLFFITNLPALILCGLVALALRRLSWVRPVERVMVAGLVAYVLVWDVANIIEHRMPDTGAVVSGAPVFLMAAIVLCLVVPQEKVRLWLFCFYALDVSLQWINLMRLPFSNVHSTTLTAHIVTAVALVCLSMIGLYQRLVLSARADLDTMRNLAHTDPLTGLPNRRSMYQALEQAGGMAIALIDLDDFKRVNDELGHPAGDRVLEEVAALLQQSLPRGATVGRWGGEEFLAVLPRTSTADAVAWAEGARLSMEELDSLTTLSVGVTSHTGSESNAELLKRADALMYEAKRDGKNRVRGG